MKTAVYTKTAKGDGYQFQVTPAPKTSGGCAGVLFSLLIAFLIGLICAYFNIYFAIIVFIGVALWVFLKLDMRTKSHRTASTFFVSPMSIEANGQTITKSSIHRIIIRNAYDKKGKIVVTGQPISTGAGIGQGLRQALEQICYSVNVEAEGKSTQLAGGLDEVTANGVLTEISQILGIREMP